MISDFANDTRTMVDIQEAIRRKGITQRELAMKLGVSVQAVNATVRGRAVPSEKQLRRYAEALKVDIKDLYSDFI